ncbi:MAG: DUF5686 family protein, partial [Chitinophagaceae bacterium]
MRRALLFLLIIGVTACASAQSIRLSGRVTNAAREPIALVSVQVKGWQSGTLTKEDGTFSLLLEEDKYDIIFSIVGYKTQVITLGITKNYVQDIILEEDRSNLENVIVKARYKDGAVEIIKKVIRHKDSLQSVAGAWSCKVYIKAVQQDSSLRTKKAKPGKDTLKENTINRDIAGMAMTEILLKLDYASEQKIKEERIGVKKLGSSENLFYLSATEGFFNFYNNLLKVPGLSTAPFLSPVSYSGLLAYRFRTIKTEKKGTGKWFTISVKPRQLSSATVEGEITISDSSWRIEHTRFRFPRFHLPQYDFFEVEQWYETQNNVAVLSRQQFTYRSKTGRNKLSGHTTVTYDGYELNRQFPKNYFGVELSATSEEAYKRDSNFWQTARKEPLTKNEIRLIQYKDSIYRVTHTKQYLDSIDRVINKFTWKKLLITGQTLYNRELEQTLILPSLIGFYQPFAFGGARINPAVAYFKIYESKKSFNMYGNISYGFRNRDVNGYMRISKMYNPFNRGFFGVSLQRDFDYIFEGDAWINMLKRNNQYLKNALGVFHGREISNGLFVYADLDIALRKSLEDYKTSGTIDSLFGNLLTDNRAIAFKTYNAVYGKIRLEYTPFQRVIREPR